MASIFGSRRGPRTLHARTILARSIVALLFATQAHAASAPAASSIAVARPTDIRNGDAIVGALSMSQPMHIEVALKLRHREDLDAFIGKAGASAARGVFAPPMTSDAFLANHAPTPAQAQAVADWLASKGYTNIHIAPNRMLVSADGTARTARDAFETTFAQVRTRDGRMAFANVDEARIPAALSGTVLAVLGLQSVHIGHVFSHQVTRPATQAGPQTPQATGHDPTAYPAIYGVGTAAAATDVTVGIITEGKLTQTITDLGIFTSGAGLPAVLTQVVNTNGTSGDTSGLNEWNLDSQDIVGMAGGVKKIIFYDVPDLFDNNIAADINTAVAANATKIVSVSIGLCETDEQADGVAATEDQSFLTGVAQGQTFSIATGDDGSDECPNDGKTTPVPSWPAASQYVVAVTGTELFTDSVTHARTSEVVWTGTGGSPSTFETQPTWQAAFVPAGVTKRDVADVAFDGDPSTGSFLVLNGAKDNMHLWGGTSLSAPLFAGVWARMLHQYPTIGFAGPVLYALPAAAFHDITSGSNGAETAKAGYDSASGRGSMIIGTAVTDASTLGNHAPVANWSSSVTASTVHFTDSSTDADGNLSTHGWTFGDGATSTQANPVHMYASAGTFSVTETVKDKVGASAAKTASVVTTIPSLIHNSGFETGHAAPWSISPAAVLTNNAGLAHAGSWLAALGGGSGAHTDRITQPMTLPAGATKATLTFYLHLTTAETTTTVANDHMSVQVLSADGNTVLGTLATYSNLNATGGYVLKTLDMSAFLGQSVEVRFLGVNNATLPTTWDVDDVLLKIH